MGELCLDAAAAITADQGKKTCKFCGFVAAQRPHCSKWPIQFHIRVASLCSVVMPPPCKQMQMEASDKCTLTQADKLKKNFNNYQYM